jgi:hypothetical protein
LGIVFKDKIKKQIGVNFAVIAILGIENTAPYLDFKAFQEE